jgi:hypothetical protein
MLEDAEALKPLWSCFCLKLLLTLGPVLSSGFFPLATRDTKDLDQGPEDFATLSLTFSRGVAGEAKSAAELGE